MSSRSVPRALRRHHVVAWWAVAAWASLGLLIMVGLAAAAGMSLR